MLNNIMATPVSQIDLPEMLSNTIDFIERIFGFSPGAKGILNYLGVKTEDVTLLDLMTSVAVIVSLIVAVGILYSIIRISQVRSTDKMVKRELGKRGVEKRDNEQWKKIMKFAHNDNPHDWKLAIREADILLDVVVSGRGHRGTTFEDRLVTMPHSEDAEIAHGEWIKYIQKGGDEYMLTKSKTKEILSYYEKALITLNYL